MVEHIHQHREMFRPLEVRTSVERRRRWPQDLKGRIVAASFAPGAIVADVAREHDISPQHLHQWRRAARKGALVVPVDDDLGFAPVVLDRPGRARTRERVVELEVSGAVIRVDAGTDLELVAAVVRALRS